MASTYTTNLRLTKQGDGENPNSWGQILNDGVISLADSAIAGYTQVSIGSAATVTLTENQGSNDEARSAFLEFTGSIGTAHTSIFVLIPNNSKGYVVRNSVSTNNATDAVIMRVAGNAGVTIPSDENRMVITNGTSVYSVIPSNFPSSITVKGNVSVSGNMNIGGNTSIGGNVTISGDVHVSSKVCASAFYGDGTNLTGAMPTGAILPYAVSAAPTGFVLCNGAALNRSTYSTLFAVVSSLYGDGDGSSTFNVPDLRGRYIAGWDVSATASSVLTSVTVGMVINTTMANTGGIQAVTLTEAQMPSHVHTLDPPPGTASGGDQKMQVADQSVTTTVATESTGGDGAHSNIPPTIILNYIIKT
jgi:microcystin-dependent protein